MPRASNARQVDSSVVSFAPSGSRSSEHLRTPGLARGFRTVPANVGTTLWINSELEQRSSDRGVPTPTHELFVQRCGGVACSCDRSESLDDDRDAFKTATLAQRKGVAAKPSSGPFVARLVTKVLNTPGKPLDPAIRSKMESYYHHDFASVRVHNDENAGESARALTAHAYTVGQHVVFATGRYGPSTTEGRRMLAHELGHVVQQSAGPVTGRRLTKGLSVSDPNDAYEREVDMHADRFIRTEQHSETANNARKLVPLSPLRNGSNATVQRFITIQNPGSQTPHPSPVALATARLLSGVSPSSAAAFLATQTNALMAQSWIDQLCPGGGWRVDPATGVISSATHAIFCATHPVTGRPHRTSSGAPTSCGCLCALSGPGSANVRIHVADSFTVGGATIDVTASGEGVQVPPTPGHPEHNVGISGLGAGTVRGAGDTSPLAGAGRSQFLRDPAWIIFGHEVCGHARLHNAFAPFGHVTSPEGNRSAVDVENRVRREHSTTGASFGVRRGGFTDAAGAFHFGGEYVVGAGESLSRIATRCGIGQAQRRSLIFRAGGVAITEASEGTLAIGERLLVDGIDWHEVIRQETMTSVATLWDVPLASLIRANTQVSDPAMLRVGIFLLVPRS